MDFGSAIKALKQGMRVTRAGWTTGFFISMMNSGGDTPTLTPTIWLRKSLKDDGSVALIDQTDILADDWEIS